MAVAWFICGYKRKQNVPFPARYCSMNDFTPQIRADGGEWREIEFLGDRALVKVRASASTLTAIAGTTGFRRIPSAALDNQLSTLTQAQRNALRNEVLDAGYTMEELNARFPNLAQATIGQVLRFLCTRKRMWRFDSQSDAFVTDGSVVACSAFEYADAVRDV